ncbi:MAG: site-specific integrase, partial [Bacteroidota bacterium]
MSAAKGALEQSTQAGTVDLLAQVPQEQVWLAGLRSERTRRAYKLDVEDFIHTLGLTSSDELYRVTPAAVLAWRSELETRGVRPATVRRKLSALSSLFRHLVEQHLADFNPVRDIKRPAVSRTSGKTAAFS